MTRAAGIRTHITGDVRLDGTILRRYSFALESRSEINVRTLAAATVATTNSPCHRDRDSFGTISGIDIMRSEARQANPPYNGKATPQ
jgi:hypothetical protein